MNERCADYYTTVRLVCVEYFFELFGQSYTILQVHVHFPVTCNNFLSHSFVFILRNLNNLFSFSFFFIQLLQAHIRSASDSRNRGKKNQRRILVILPGILLSGMCPMLSFCRGAFSVSGCGKSL